VTSLNVFLQRRRLAHPPFHALAALLALVACDAENSGNSADGGASDAALPIEVREEECATQENSNEVDFLAHVGCRKDFDLLASVPLDANLPGAQSVKVVIDQADGDKLYFQNSQRYQIHYEFASSHLSGNGKPQVPALAEFNRTEYYKPDRRFILGAVTYYEGPRAWVFELSPYDTASAEMIGRAMSKIADAAYFGPALAFHPTSSLVEIEAKKLPSSVRQTSTDDIYAGTDYQPLTLGRAMGRLHLMTAAQLETEYVPYRDIVVLDKVPNDISVVSGIVTEEFQTPLSHINVLSQNRGTPNMGLRGASTNAKLKALDGKWVELTVEASGWAVREVTMAEADSYWQAHRPKPVTLPALDLSVTAIKNIEDVVPETSALREDLKKAVLAFGGKAAHYSILAKTPGVPLRKAFAIPVYYYDQFMRENGFYQRIDALLADTTFQGDPAVRDQKLAALRADMEKAPINAAFEQALKAKLDADYPKLSMRFRTSTNSEDLEGFPCAGCYESHTGNFDDWEDVRDAIRETWSTVWLFRTFEERTYYGVEHRSVGMALLVHENFPDEEANGVALTANPFDESGLEPSFYVNVQWGGEAEVVHPPPGISTDEFLYFFDLPNRPITYISHSNLVNDGETVLSTRQVYELGQALKAIHDRFSPAYGPASGNTGFYAMDIEFKFDAPKGQTPTLFVKQARPYPGRNKGAQ
jgi:pyruvate,water dikinase